MKAIEFNHGWAYRHLDTDEAFVPVTVPHDAMLAEPRTPLAASGLNSGWFEGRDYEYVKRFTPDAALAGSSMILEFEGVYHDAEVWVNGERSAYRPYGYTNFTVDVTDRFVAGAENEVRVIARNADQPNSRWYSGAGIYRPVTLWVAPREHIALDGVTVQTLSIGTALDISGGVPEPARVRFTVETTAPGSVSVEVTAVDPSRSAIPGIDGSAVAVDGKAVIELDVPNPCLWSLDEPDLYSARIRYTAAGETADAAPAAVDETTVTFGIREIAWGSEGFKINGERVLIQGACIHHDNGVLGACAYADAEERKIALMKANGYNAIRSAHNPCSKALLDAADRLGVLVMDEYIDHWYIHKTQHDYVDHFDEWWRRDLTDMVVKDRNHPSVVLYSTGNEVGETAQPRGIALTREMTDFLHGLDPTRPVTCGINIFFNFLTTIGVGQYSDKKAAKEAEAAERRREAGDLDTLEDKHTAVGSEFFNNLAGLLGAGFMKTMATLPPCDWATRGAFANMDVAGYNYGIKRYAHDLRKYPKRLILGSETFCSDAYRFREFAKRNPRVIGDFVWAGMDYMGETGIGSWEYEDYAPLRIGYGWLTAGSGRLDLSGRPLGEAYYTRVALEAPDADGRPDRGPYLAVCPVNHTGDRHSPSAWKMSNAIDSWAWNGCEGRRANVEVYARAASVALLVNGREVARKALRGDCIVRFSCEWEPGEVTAVSYDESGREIGRRSLRSAGERTELRAAVEWPVAGDGALVIGIDESVADGGVRSGSVAVRPGHLAFVRVRYTDESGITKPLERGIVHATVDGGDLLGFGSAAPHNPGSFLDADSDTYYGETLAVIRVPETAVRGDTVTATFADDAGHQTTLAIAVA
ncbi:glycoside hydrolase family 2 TIM barrel-domain containing protein [Bifidobacterium aerophilum]|uniref:DUF4982 domain-containing protein n=1 Tax=Bifidobacterium aerophilum TaxID=1798155 RepID=A0A6N9Z5R1_9BIFI|nr:DUF4982 domain-containing protein [Bifidobacterium aerophilum]